jgi:hypothetical protein
MYTLPGISEEERMLVESFYSDTYESGWTGVYRKLTNDRVTEVSTEERKLIIGMVSSLFFRNLSWKRFYDQFMGETIQKVYDFSIANGQEVFVFEGEHVSIKGKTADQIKREMWEKDKPDFIITQTLASIKLLKLRLESDGLVVMRIQNLKQHFITSDRPVALRDPDNQRLVPINPKYFISLPLDHKHMLLLIPERPKQNILEIYRNDASDVDPFVWNTQQFGLAHKYLMGSETGLQQYSDMVRRVNSKGSESK